MSSMVKSEPQSAAAYMYYEFKQNTAHHIAQKYDCNLMTHVWKIYDGKDSMMEAAVYITDDVKPDMIKDMDKDGAVGIGLYEYPDGTKMLRFNYPFEGTRLETFYFDDDGNVKVNRVRN